MKFTKDHIWPLVGVAAMVLSVWLLMNQLRHISMDDMMHSLQAVPHHNWLMAMGCTIVAFAALAGYDRLALRHLRRNISFLFVSATSFTTYALAHNIGASVVSGALVRYRAYSSKGMNGAEIGVLVAFCSFTFALASLFLGGLVLLYHPDLLEYFLPHFPHWAAHALAIGMLCFVGLYVFGSALNLPPLQIRSFALRYPRLRIVLQQLIIGPLEILGAAGIIYFALPADSNPGYVIVLGIFLASFTAALLSHAPGGIGVLEALFFIALPEINQADLLAALLIFRLFYFILPFAISIVLVALFERKRLMEYLRQRTRKKLR